MARKEATTELRIAQEFRRWMKENPNLKKPQRYAAFNRIADKHLTNDQRKSNAVC